MIDILKLYDKDFKVTSSKMLKGAITNILKPMEKSKASESLSKRIEDVKKNEMKVLELKNTITKITSSVYRLNR